MIPTVISVDKKKGYIIDYSLISASIIENNFILFNSYARFINKNIEEIQKIDNYPRPFSIPSYDLKGKSSQVYLSDYVINTALFTFFKTRDLELVVKPNMLPKNLPLIKLNTNWLNIIFKDLSNTYGMDKDVSIKLIVSENPQLSLKEDMISFNLPSNVEVMVDGVQEVVVKFKTHFVVDVVLNVLENNRISGNIKSFNIKDTKIISSYTKDEEFGTKIQNQFNIMKGLALPFINMYVLKNINFKLPVIKGIKFTDLTVSHHNNFLIINYNFEYNEKENIPEEKKNEEKKEDKQKKENEDKKEENEKEKKENEDSEKEKEDSDKDDEEREINDKEEEEKEENQRDEDEKEEDEKRDEEDL